MKCANTNEEFILPVVHIRIVRESVSHTFACDFCQKSFEFADDLTHHVNSSHSSLNIQEVYVCPSCRCCVLSHNDLLDHLSARHHVETGIRENSTLCEYCGLNLMTNQCLMDHLVLEHYSGMTETYVSVLGIVELSLKDIFSMGMGNPDCKTLFQVTEVSLTKYRDNSSESVTKATKINCVRPDNLQTGIEDIVNNISFEDTSQQCSQNINVISSLGSRSLSSITETAQGFPDVCGNSLNEIIYEQNEQEECESQLEMIICCDTDEKSAAASSPGEIILTIESEEELIWSKDIMSQVICSSGILKRSPGSTERKEPVSQSVTVEQVKNWGDGYSPGVNHGTQAQQQAHCEGKHSDGIPDRQCHLNMHDLKMNFTKPSVIDTGAKSCNWHLLSSVKNGSTKKVKTSFSAQRGGQKEKVCNICKMVFSHRGSLEQHENACHGIRIKCDVCDASFVFSKSLRNHHLRKHASTDGFKCEDCDKIFKCRSNLWSHRLVHLSQEMRKFPCPQCPQRFTTKSKLNIHLKIHTGKQLQNIFL
ncbi:uncharacterized protein [Procambarus clarkii]|uniref:uncharacterized protein isoform X1 n=1 Tax=Procambarus clarkii TaxID=6728 RepID=UPI0037445A58